MGVFLNRGLESQLSMTSPLPVTILEGRRAVGKTTLLRNLVLPNGEKPAFYSFSEGFSLREATRNPQEWLSRLPTYSIIDEAQLLPQVTQHVKVMVDQVGDQHRFILCGSAGIGRSRRGEPDWLTGRARRLQLLPFSSGELSGVTDCGRNSLVDALFNWDWETQGESIRKTLQTSSPRREFNSTYSNLDLIATLRYGGLPSLNIPESGPTITSLAQVNLQVKSENEMALGRELVPGQTVDISRARSVLDALLGYPGGILNKNRLAGDIGMDARTVTRYIDILAERFMIYGLPNFKESPSRIGRGAPKIHAVDTSTTCESLSRRGYDISTHPRQAGQVLETWVANQLRAELGWAKTACELGYWRVNLRGREDEVDIVLLDEISRAIGVEVKLTANPSSSDFRGLRSFREDCQKTGRKFLRGFVVCNCQEVQQFETDLWAVPYRLLGNYPIPPENKPEEVFEKMPQVMVPSGQTHEAESPAASIFVSYAHKDNDTVYGALLELVEKIQDMYELKTGERLEVFTDRNNLKWGDSWEHIIKSQLETTAFLLSFVSPRYLKSDICRDEVEKFAVAAQTANYKAILPVLIQEIPVSLKEDAVWMKLKEYQYVAVSISDLRSKNREKLDLIADEVSSKLQATIESRQEISTEANELEVSGETPEKKDSLTLEEIVDGIQELSNHLRNDATIFGEELNNMMKLLEQGMDAMTVSNLKTAVIAKHTRILDPQSERVNNAALTLSKDWKVIQQRLGSFVKLSKELYPSGEDSVLQDIRITLEQLYNQTWNSDLDKIKLQIPMLGKISRLLRPTEQALMNAIRTIESIHNEIGLMRDSSTR